MRKLLMVSISAALLGAGIAQGGEAKSDPKRLTMSFYQEVINAHNPAAVDKFVASDFVDHNPDPGQKPGAAGLKATFTDMFGSIPDVKLEVLQTVVQGDVVVARVTLSGTQKGPFMGMAASGRTFKIGGIDMIRIKDGKAIERWGYFDSMAMQQQLAPPAAPKLATPPKK